MRTAVKLLTCAFGIVAGASLVQAQTNVISDPVGFYKVNINAGANFMSAPLHAVHSYRGLVDSVAGNIVTLSGTPGFTVNAYGPALTGGPAPISIPQYVMIVRQDSDTNSPTVGDYEGDWWLITANAAGTLTLDPAQGAPTSFIGAGDQIEVRKMTSLKDLFGTNGGTINKSTNGVAETALEDVIRRMNGTSFGTTIFYLDNTTNPAPGTNNHWIFGGKNAGDGSIVTFEPDEPLMLFRKTGSAPTNVVSLGQVHTKRLTHYLIEGANTYANPFPANALMKTSGLLETPGWVSSANNTFSTLDEDGLRILNGTSYGSPIFHIFNPPNTNTWFGGGMSTNPTVGSGSGYMIFIKAGTGGRTWRQRVPFALE